MSDAPLCKNCRWFVFNTSLGWRCRRPIGAGNDLVHGYVRHFGNYEARRERDNEHTFFGRRKCGPEGLYFQAGAPPCPPVGGTGAVKKVRA